MALVAVAGPFGNLVLVLVSLGIAAVLARTMGSVDPAAQVLLQTMIGLNVLLMVFNLLPLHPLDGGKILAAFLPTRLDYVDDFLLQYGGWIVFGLVVFGRHWMNMLLGPVVFVADQAYRVAVLG
jgi:Zn-dependent protease